MTSTAQTGIRTYAIDPVHSAIGFVVHHLGIAPARGALGTVSGTLSVGDGSEVPERIEASVDLTGLDSRNEKRDGHLKSPEFFNVEQYAAATFRSTRISGSADAFTIDGELTLLGTMRPVTLQARFGGRRRDQRGNERIGYAAQAKLNRREFGMTWDQAVDGTPIVADDVTVELSIEAVLQG